MTILYLQIIGCGLFAMSAFVLGILLRKYPSKIFAGKITMIMHPITIAAVILIMVEFISPGLTHSLFA